MKERIKNMLTWSMHNRAEDVKDFKLNYYYWTPEAKKILNRILILKRLEREEGIKKEDERDFFTMGNSILMGIIGKSGVGKSALAQALYAKLLEFYNVKEPDLFFHISHLKYESGKKLNTSQECKEFLTYTVNTALIETPDYAKRDVRKINRDLDRMFNLWETFRGSEWKCENVLNFVFFFQKELVEKTDHFFLRKMDIIELKPLTPEQLIEAFKLKFKTCEPFSEEALTLIAELSRGIFRRFMRYIQLCLEDMLEREKNQVKVEDVKNVITPDVLMHDLDLELSDIFRNERYKRISIMVLKHLREHGSVNQKTLAEILDVHATILGRILSTLEDNGYVKRERGRKKELIIKIQ